VENSPPGGAALSTAELSDESLDAVNGGCPPCVAVGAGVAVAIIAISQAGKVKDLPGVRP
jgi:lactobin A/cerein 7B family class IIb bacteriocin